MRVRKPAAGGRGHRVGATGDVVRMRGRSRPKQSAGVVIGRALGRARNRVRRGFRE